MSLFNLFKRKKPTVKEAKGTWSKSTENGKPIMTYHTEHGYYKTDRGFDNLPKQRR